MFKCVWVFGGSSFLLSIVCAQKRSKQCRRANKCRAQQRRVGRPRKTIVGDAVIQKLFFGHVAGIKHQFFSFPVPLGTLYGGQVNKCGVRRRYGRGPQWNRQRFIAFFFLLFQDVMCDNQCNC